MAEEIDHNEERFDLFECGLIKHISKNELLSSKFLFFYDLDGQLIGEYRDNTSTATSIDDCLVRQKITWLGDITVAVITKPAASEIQVHYIHADHLNTPWVIVNQNNTIVWRWESTHAFGTTYPTKTRTATVSYLNTTSDSQDSILIRKSVCTTTISTIMNR